MPLPIRHTHPSKDMHLVYRAKFLGPFLDEPLRIPAILPGGSYEGQGVRDNSTVPAAVKLLPRQMTERANLTLFTCTC